MCTITTTEFKNHFGKYVDMAQKEEIQVTKRGVVIFKMTPERFSLVNEAISFLNLLPRGTTIGEDPNERD